jgi:hypothetical protein
MLPRLPIVLLLAGCAPATLTAHDHDAPFVKARAAEGCGSGDEGCCQRLEESVREARTRFDDRAADEAIERIALSCPVQARAVLDRQGQRVRRLSPEASAEIRVKYQLDLAPEDRLFWAAAYVDGHERVRAATKTAHQIEVEVQVVPGPGARAGELVRLKQARPLPLEGDADVTVKLRRQDGAEPFALDVQVDAGDVGQEGGVEGSVADVLTKADVARLPRYDNPRRAVAPDFYAPSELLLSTASPVWMQNCVGPDGRIVHSGMGTRHGRPPHPRLMGAALDWLRRFQYQPPQWDRGVLMVCEEFEVRFDQSPRPAPPPAGVVTAEFAPR